ncbi:MAG: lysine transporter LysE [Thaumarchaeota archaeon]|nr:lysine transporter LysE [Nitrososphaerota archaeon]
MQEFFAFFATVIVVSVSGVMAPGPLFAATISSGLKQRLAGFKIAIGHTAIELPLVVMIGLGVLSLESFPQFRIIITALGAVSIFGFAALQLRSALREVATKDSKHGPLLTGILLTGLNPFFLVWWFTIGIKLISDAMVLWSFWGILVMFALHIWMDYAWLMFVSASSAKSAKILSGKSYKIFMIGINVVLVYFGITFLLEIF